MLNILSDITRNKHIQHICKNTNIYIVKTIRTLTSLLFKFESMAGVSIIS